MKIHSFTTMSTVAVALALAASLWGCGGGLGSTPNPIDLSKSLTLTSYASCDELEAEIKGMLIGEMERNLDGMKQWCRYDDVPVYGPAEEGGDAAATAQDRAETTETNVQEAGVDEGDLIKTDGQHAFAIVGNVVKVVRVWPFDQFGTVATITPKNAPSHLYLADNRLIVLSTPSLTDIMPMDCMSASGDMLYSSPCNGDPSAEVTTEEVYDVTTPSTPVLVKERTYQGILVDSRRISSTLYLVLSSQGIVYPALDYDLGIPYERLPQCTPSGTSTPTGEMLTAIARLKNKNRAIIQAMNLGELLPTVAGEAGPTCTSIARSPAASGTSLVTVVADTYTDTLATPAYSAVLGNAGAIYVSPSSLYLTASVMPYGWWTVENFSFTDSTIIHRFSLEGGAPAYRGSVEAEGRLVDNGFAGSRYSSRFSMASFALSEYEGHLRAATTATTYTNDTVSIDNRISTFSIEDASLLPAASVGGMGIGETMRAARFIGPRAYIVTFKKTDPLYVVDLADPAAPTVAGELEVPGFSTYLHPLDDGHLIGLGFNADDMDSFAWTQGLKLALFDVSDPSQPSEVGNRTIGDRGSYSPAVEEHHAFTLDRTRGLLALPVEIYSGGSGGGDYGTFSFAGVMVLKADLSGTFDTLGTIVIDTNDPDGMPGWWGSPSSAPLRTVIIGDGANDGVLSLSPTSLRLNRIDGTMSTVGIVE